MENPAKTDQRQVVFQKDSTGIYRLRQHGGFDQWAFVQSKLRPLIIPSIEPLRTYAFISTAAHPDALEALAEEDKKKEHRENDEDFFFNKPLMCLYLRTVEALAETKGNFNDIAYDLVQARSHGWPHWEAARWPTMHIIPARKTERFEALVNQLNDDAAYAIITRLEGPHNYLMPQVDFLRRNGLKPLTSERHATIWGRTLVQAVNLLCPFGYHKREPSNSDD